MSEPAVDVRKARPWPRPLSIAVLLVVVAFAVGGFVLTRSVVSDQEHKLLKQRTDEVALVLSTVTSSLRAELGPLAASAAAGPATFQRSASPLTSGPSGTGFDYVALVSTVGEPHIVAAAGSSPEPGVTGVRAAAVRQAVAKTGSAGALVGTPLFDGSKGARRIGFAFGSPVLHDAVIYAESEVHPRQQSSLTASQPFSELVVAVYVGRSAHADQLLVATTPTKDLPLRGHTAHTLTTVGDGVPWLLVTKARHPLVGSVATAMPWVLLGAGLVAALLATLIVETLARRREYALGLVRVRTDELEKSLADLATAHEQLVRAERLAAIGQLASSIGHELRNPLGVLSNAVYLLRADLGPTPDPKAERHLLTAEREVSAATVIVSDLLEFARQRAPVFDDVELRALADEVLAVLPPPAGIEVRREDPAGDVSVRADRDMLRQVVVNLVANAYQAMPDGGTVTLGVGRSDGAVQIRVRDTGEGIADEARAQLFEPFFTTKARGIGLGLAVTKRIVEAHGGDVSVASDPGDGAEFTVTLPVVAQQRPAPDAATDSQAAR